MVDKNFISEMLRKRIAKLSKPCGWRMEGHKEEVIEAVLNKEKTQSMQTRFIVPLLMSFLCDYYFKLKLFKYF